MVKERLKDLVAQNYLNKQKIDKDNTLFKARREVEINGNGTSGYVIKQGLNKGKILNHIQTPLKVI